MEQEEAHTGDLPPPFLFCLFKFPFTIFFAFLLQSPSFLLFQSLFHYAPPLSPLLLHFSLEKGRSPMDPFLTFIFFFILSEDSFLCEFQEHFAFN